MKNHLSVIEGGQGNARKLRKDMVIFCTYIDRNGRKPLNISLTFPFFPVPCNKLQIKYPY